MICFYINSLFCKRGNNNYADFLAKLCSILIKNKKATQHLKVNTCNAKWHRMIISLTCRSIVTYITQSPKMFKEIERIGCQGTLVYIDITNFYLPICASVCKMGTVVKRAVKYIRYD